jgi:hypothetical protein
LQQNLFDLTIINWNKFNKLDCWDDEELERNLCLSEDFENCSKNEPISGRSETLISTGIGILNELSELLF